MLSEERSVALASCTRVTPKNVLTVPARTHDDHTRVSTLTEERIYFYFFSKYWAMWRAAGYESIDSSSVKVTVTQTVMKHSNRQLLFNVQ
jgi:hypothetical protein